MNSPTMSAASSSTEFVVTRQTSSTDKMVVPHSSRFDPLRHHEHTTTVQTASLTSRQQGSRLFLKISFKKVAHQRRDIHTHAGHVLEVIDTFENGFQVHHTFPSATSGADD
ncbi:hypothetical protein MKEN_01289800 [Mycena kentingensis (nom. inval.)]|nr:hypothetical protein MKEN_01289800 [Mycena kentingensis (nom. inval.)]